MQPVWVLSVDLQTKTATFQSGLSDAAKSARGAFTQIKGGAGEMGREVSGNMMEARHGVILLGEEFGIHLPRGVTSFLASIGPVGAAMEAAFPFLAIAVGATILIEKLVKMHEEGLKITEDQAKFATAVNNAFNQLDAKLLQAQIRSDELRGDHLAALKLQLDLIDRQSMEELVHSFEEVAKIADVVMKSLEGHWYTFGIGSDGAKSTLDEFKGKYEHLLSLHTDAGKQEASNLLTGTLKTAQDVLQAQHAIQANRNSGEGNTDDSHAAERTLAAHKASLTVTEKEVAAQQALVDALQKQAAGEREVAGLKKSEGDNDKLAAAKSASSEHSAGAREAAESQLRMGQQAIAADRALAEAHLTIKRASVQERLAVEIDFAQRDYDLQVAGNTAQIAALDKMAPGYTNALKALHDKALELEATHATQVTELTSKASVAQAAKDLAAMEQGEREKIEATQRGSSARLAAINEAIKQEEAAGLQDTNFYRELLNQRVQLTEEMTEEESRLRDAATKQVIAADAVAAREQTRHLIEMSKIEKPKGSGNNDFAMKAAELDKEYQANHAALMKELIDTQSMGQAKVAEQRKINDELAALEIGHRDRMAENAAAQAQAEKVAAMETANAWGQSLLRVAQGHESMAKMAQTAFAQMISASLQAALMEVAHEKTAQLAHAEAAAAAAFHAMSGIPVVGPALGAVAAAATFAGAMAFREGGVVPGVALGDVVPAMLEPGEGVVPKSVMGSLRDLARNGGMGGGVHYNIASPHFSPTIHALDADGVDEILEKHADKFHKAFEHTVRKLNH